LIGLKLFEICLYLRLIFKIYLFRFNIRYGIIIVILNITLITLADKVTIILFILSLFLRNSVLIYLAFFKFYCCFTFFYYN